MSTEITRSRTPEEDELAKKLAELATLEGELAERELELATLLSELHVFERRYLGAVGSRYAELDELRAQIAEAQARRIDDPGARSEAAEARARANESAETAEAARGEYRAETFEPTDKIKKLYRDLAKRIHPDLANKDADRARRTRLMAEANRAYEEGDEIGLRGILRDWESSPETVEGEGPGAELVRAIRKIAQVRSRLDAIQREMNQARESHLYTLKAKVDEAHAEGRDLLAEMAAAIDREIKDARAQMSQISDEKAGA